MKRKKSINDIVNQFIRMSESYQNTSVSFVKIFSAYKSAFEKRFGFMPHSYECQQFCKKYGKDFKI